MKENSAFPELHGKLGFGTLHLPIKDGNIDYDEFSKMVDMYINSGFNYFDTAHAYLGGQSEVAIGDCVSSRYDRSSFVLANKLTSAYFKKKEEIRPFFENQLRLCKVDNFDFYLMHAQDKVIYQKFKRCEAYETVMGYKDEGLIRHFGISFHDKAEVLDTILNEYPEIEFVQIQLNYIDYDDVSVEARKVYEVCEKYDKPVLVMEPIKGGSLVNLPKEAECVFHKLGDKSSASYALRFVASFPNVVMVLSGMSNLIQVKDNINIMNSFSPLNQKEKDAITEVCNIIRSLNLIPCSACRYCIEENNCPKDIVIPEMFSLLNAHEAFHNWNTAYYYGKVVTKTHGKASDCIKCGKCEKVCPQHLNIRELLMRVSHVFE